jgi:hypothetical protein
MMGGDVRVPSEWGKAPCSPCACRGVAIAKDQITAELAALHAYASTRSLEPKLTGVQEDGHQLEVRNRARKHLRRRGLAFPLLARSQQLDLRQIPSAALR